MDGTPLVVDTRKAFAILVLLAVEHRPFAREELAALLWPESDDESARGALRRTLSVLRVALGDRWLLVDRSTVALDPGGVWVDLRAVEASVGAASAAALRDAAAAARGPFLAGFSLRDSPDFDDWRATRAVAIERTVADVLDRLVVATEADGDVVGAVAAAARRVDLDPLDEAAQRRLMRLLAVSGDRAGAIRQYRACVAILERELGVAPLAETTALYEAVRDERPAAVEPVAFAAHPPPPTRLPMVGRDAPLAGLLAGHAAAASDGRVAFIVGEAGIGKSRLAEEVARAVAATGGRTLLARAYASEAGIAYGSILGLLRAGLALPDAVDRLAALSGPVLREVGRLAVLPDELVPGPARPVPGQPVPARARAGDLPAARARLLDAIAAALTVLCAGSVPGLIVIEDLQWADHASRESVAWLARRLAGRPILLLLTWRPEDLDELGDAFSRGVEGLSDVLAVPLDRLDRQDVERLVAAASGAGLPAHEVEPLLLESEGLPLYVVEALAAGAGTGDGSARSVRALFRERLATVSETAGQVLTTAAVIGRSFDLPLLHGASGRSEDETITALEELVQRGIVREVPNASVDAFDFAHAKLRDAAYGSASLARRRLLHRRVAELLRADADKRDDPARLVQIAIHERAAGRDAEAAEAFRDAGMRARALFAHHEAASHLDTALALGHPDAVGILCALGEIRTAQGDYAGAINALEAAAADTPDEDLPAVELLLGRVHARRGDLATAASHLDAAIAGEERRAEGHLGLASGSDTILSTRALVERAVVAHRAAEDDLAWAFASRALLIAGAAGDRAGAGAAHRILGLVSRARGDLDEARSSLQQSLELAQSDADAGAAIAARNALALVEADAGNRPAAIALLDTALEACRRTGERHLEAAIENNLADQLHALGRNEEAMTHLKHAVATFADIGGRPEEPEPEIWKLVTW